MPEILVGQWVRVPGRYGGYHVSRVYQVDEHFITLDAEFETISPVLIGGLARYIRDVVEPLPNYCAHCGRHDG